MSRRALAILALAVSFAATAAVAVALWPDREANGHTRAESTVASAGDKTSAHAGPGDTEPTRTDGLIQRDSLRGPSAAATGAGTAPAAQTQQSEEAAAADSKFALQTVPPDPPVQVTLKHPPAAGVLFDVDSGEVLWQRHATVSRPIASLTKLMTALMVTEGDAPTDQVLISPKAAHTPGSATGVLPQGKKVPLDALLQALIMISANDAAVALAEHYAGSVQAFIKDMNDRAVGMGLDCTHFTTPNGLRDRGNYSCPLDVAALARADLANGRIAQIARTRYATPAFPIKGGKLHLANNHYFLQRGIEGVPGAEVTGLKTGFTDPAGRCYVTTARLGGTHLGVVLLGSPDPFRQVPQLLHAGFQEDGALPAPVPTSSSKPVD